jgi:sulfotransferase family protein
MTETAIHRAQGATPPGRHEPVFILAPARSYSTVSTALLAGHPAIFGFPEMLIFPGNTVGDLMDKVLIRPNNNPAYINARLSGIYRAVAEVHEGDQSDDAISRAMSWLRSRADWPTTQLMDHLLESVKPKIGLEKSPETVDSDQALEACMKAYPNARYLHLTRHPVSTQHSLYVALQQSLLQPLPKKQAIAVCASAWYLAHVRIMRALTALPQAQWIRVRAEDLLGDPLLWLPRILDWLGLDHDDKTVHRMMRTEQWRFSGTGPSSKLYGGDPKFMTRSALRPVAAPGPIEFEQSWELHEELIRRMTVLAGHLGY